ncbi:putative dihydrolipoyllysine-residue succinyltransferase component of 2-oxoglutarate dehydrogenase complex [Venturia inaequalis]|nr:putative dihydrolipoyllysine-residue succinyltransferase component of 2-oxoglutarate dehydrogenase complex [Venturia inaequalis]
MCNGIYGMKPSSTVFPNNGQQSPGAEGGAGFAASTGPMATSMRACRFLLEKMIKADPWRYDFGCDKLSWVGNKVKTQGSKLRVAYVEDDGNYTVWPPMARALTSSIEKLKAAGVEVVPISLPAIKEILEISRSYYRLDGGEHTKSVIASTGESLIASVLAVYGRPGGGTQKTLAQLMTLNALRAQHRQLYTDFWRHQNIDCIIMSPCASVAPKLDSWRVMSYLVPWNYLDYPACIVPVGKVEECDVPGRAKYGLEDEAGYGTYKSVEDYNNAPTSIQIVGRRQHDEDLSDVATYIDSVINAK